MNDIAIQVKNLSKQYRIGGPQEGQANFREVVSNAVARPFRRIGKVFSSNGHLPGSDDTLIWALKDVSFEVKQGELVGIIGRNGAGKSTLLKILSGITEPTEGFVETRGRVASLLEVGTGFNLELTGHENIYLNGAILGMRKSEIDQNYDDIVKFSGVEKFLNTPVKHYSTGMYLRLAFAVAAHLQQEVLIVDEVLAVGDASFQKKCLTKMDEASHQGRTVLFVSHSMQAITRLCPRTILLSEGGIIEDGPSHKVVSVYLSSDVGVTAAREWKDKDQAPRNDVVRLCSVRAKTEDGKVTDAFDIRNPIKIEIEYEVLTPGHVLVPCFGCENEDGVAAFVTSDRDPQWRRKPRPVGRYLSAAYIPGNFLAEGRLIVGAGIVTEDPFILHCDEPHAIAFQVIDSQDGDSARGDFTGRLPGVVRPLLRWDTRFDSNPIASISDSGGPS